MAEAPELPAESGGTAVAYFDLENLFHPKEFLATGDFEPSREGLLAALAESGDPAEDMHYPSLADLVRKKQSMRIASRVVDLTVEWIKSSHIEVQGHTYGPLWSFGVKASRERFQHYGWKHTTVGAEPEAADRALTADVDVRVEARPETTFILGCSDAKRTVRHLDDGPIRHTVRAVESVARRRKLQHRLVAVLAKADASPQPERWDNVYDLGRIDAVYRLSQIVADTLAKRSIEPLWRRTQARPSEWESLWRSHCMMWAGNRNDGEVRKAITKELGFPASKRFERNWECFEDGLLYLTATNRARLLRLALPAVERRHRLFKEWADEKQRKRASTAIDRVAAAATIPHPLHASPHVEVEATKPTVGITGHINLTAVTRSLVASAIRAELATYGSGVVGLSSLAGGADQIFADEILLAGGDLQFVQPCTEIEDSFSADDLSIYRRQVGRCSAIVPMPFTETSDEAYEAAGFYIAETCDLLLAVWDGQPALGRGGTAAVVMRREQCGRPYKIIWPEGASRT